MTAGAAARYRAAITPYEEHRDYVLAVLKRRCGWLDASDREALLHDAYTVFLEKQRDGQLDVNEMRARQVRAYLTQTALNKAMDEGKRAGRRRSVSLDDDDRRIEPVDPVPAPDEHLAARFDDARVREIVAQLPERQQLIIKLRFFLDRSPRDIQRYLGVTERVYRRELERATRQLAKRFELVRDGSFCDSQRSLLLAYVTGVAGPSRMRAARRHLDTCPGCSSWILEIRATARRAAAFVPAPLLILPMSYRQAGRVSSAIHVVHERGAGLLATLRDQALQMMVRSDPSRVAALGNIRPTTAAMLVTGCLATGSTATYCVIQGVPAPLRAFIGVTVKPRGRSHSERTVNPHSGRVAGRSYETPAARSAAASYRSPLSIIHNPAAAITAKPMRTGRATAEYGGTAELAVASAARREYRATEPEFGLADPTPISAPSKRTLVAAVASAPAPGKASDRAPKPTVPLPEFDP